MKFRDKLRQIYPKCVCYRKGYKQPYMVYQCLDTMTVLGIGNTVSNAYANAYNNCTDITPGKLPDKDQQRIQLAKKLNIPRKNWFDTHWEFVYVNDLIKYVTKK